jgi:hypothetical protein
VRNLFINKFSITLIWALLVSQTSFAANWSNAGSGKSKTVEADSIDYPSDEWRIALEQLLGNDPSKLKGWDWTEISERAKTNVHLCDPGHWSSWLTVNGMTKKADDPRATVKRWPVELRMFGDDLTHNNSNNMGAVLSIYRETNRYLFTNEYERLKGLLVGLSEKNAFTKPKPHYWSKAVGAEYVDLSKYPPYGETIYRANYTLLAAAFGFAAVKNHLTPSQLDDFLAWGNEQVDLIENVDDLKSKSLHRVRNATDRASMKVVSLISWGLVTQQPKVLKRGLKWLTLVIKSMNSDGLFTEFLRPKKTRAIHYHNMIFSYLVPVAHLLKSNGINIYSLPNQNGATIAQGVEWLLERSMRPETRTDIMQTQVDESFRKARNNIASLSLVEFIILDGILDHRQKLLDEALQVREWRGFSGLGLEDRYGFSDMAMPGYYVSCYFSAVPGDPEFLKTNSSYSDWRRFTEGAVTWDQIDY